MVRLPRLAIIGQPQYVRQRGIDRFQTRNIEKIDGPVVSSGDGRGRKSEDYRREAGDK